MEVGKYYEIKSKTNKEIHIIGKCIDEYCTSINCITSQPIFLEIDIIFTKSPENPTIVVCSDYENELIIKQITKRKVRAYKI